MAQTHFPIQLMFPLLVLSTAGCTNSWNGTGPDLEVAHIFIWGIRFFVRDNAGTDLPLHTPGRSSSCSPFAPPCPHSPIVFYMPLIRRKERKKKKRKKTHLATADCAVPGISGKGGHANTLTSPVAAVCFNQQRKPMETMLGYDFRGMEHKKPVLAVSRQGWQAALDGPEDVDCPKASSS